MKANPRVLILTASYGNGHLQASKALYQQFVEQGIEHVKIVNLMKEGHPFINLITTKLINTSVRSSRFGLDYYGWCYYLTRETKQTALFQKSMNLLGQRKLRELIQQEQPDVVINTFPFGAAPEVCSTMGIQNFTVLTDYALHASWLHSHVDKYYVATEELKQQIVFRGVSKDRVEVSGIPIRQEFAMESMTAQGKKKNLILIMAGDPGVNSYMEDILNTLAVIPQSRFLVICGHNDKLRLRLLEVFGTNKRIMILGYVENVHEWMSQASCILTKAGGLTVTEAIALRLPIFIYKPHAGQEKENALYLSSRGVAAISYQLEELSAHINDFFHNPSLHDVVSNRMANMQRREAAAHIVRDIAQRSATPSISISM
ncbi:MGDG synthase family glycosyltransferase [Paenibacillus roseipurpureus]|uniref:Glycosyltransferase n=1 Tax=Paenibacillus roseopurpureus TaxID=2918901 RepID=A0AA96RJF1_9BACL|nr:glycosyltransferase [Paenibacillus sp. MBLB1832]WNR43101.1 glycosyltransferase [Paenibacillus sp. MBLB1832]